MPCDSLREDGGWKNKLGFVFSWMDQQLYNKMDRDIPNYNPLITNKIQQKNLHKHYQRLQSIKSSNSSRSNQFHSQHKPNRKAIQVQQDRKTQIERDNVMLFNKMMRIMKRADPCNQPHNQSRNHTRPITELNKIQEQNRTMYERLERQKPTINHRKLQQDRKKNQNILKFLGKYSQHSIQNMQQNSLRTSQATRTNPSKTQYSSSNHYLQPSEINTAIEMRTKPRYNPYELQEQVDEQDIKMHLDIANRNRKVYSSTHEQLQRNKPEVPSFQHPGPSRAQMRTAPHSAKDIILFKSKTHLSGHVFEVSIVRSHNTYEIRARQPNCMEGELLKLTLSEEEGNQLLEISNYNYKDIISRLTIRKGNLVFDQEQGQDSEGEQEEGDEWTPQSEQPEIKSFNKPSVGYFNPSHISEQNQEQSYRPAQSIHRESPLKTKKRLDSLGEEEPQQLQEQPQEQSLPEFQASQVKNNPSRLSPIAESRDNEQSPNKEESLELSVSKRAGIDATFNPQKVQNYEQALEEQIL